MRPAAAVSALALTLFISTPLLAQDWTEFVSREDGFKLDFPGQPKVQDTTFTSEYGYTLPARVYSVERGRERYLMTIVDYNGIEAMGKERVKSCPPGAEPCHGSMNTGEGYWKMDRGGAIVFATWRFLQRDAKLTHMMWNFMDLVEAQQLQLTNNADKSRTFVHVSMHMHKLYILEATVPAGYPEPGLFQQSMGYVDKDGNGVRYQKIYSNEVYGLGDAPAPCYGRGGGGQGGGGGRQGGGGGRRGGGAQ